MAFGENPTFEETSTEKTEKENTQPNIDIDELGTPKNLSNKILENGTVAKNQESIDKLDDLYETLEIALENSENSNSEYELKRFKEIINKIKHTLSNNMEPTYYYSELNDNFTKVFQDIGIDIKSKLNNIINETIYIKPDFEYVQDIKGDKNIGFNETFETILGEEYLSDLENQLPDFVDKINIIKTGYDDKDNFYMIEIIDSTGNISTRDIKIPTYKINKIREANKEGEEVKTNISKISSYVQENINTLVERLDGEIDINNNDNNKEKFKDIDLTQIDIEKLDTDNPLNILLLKKLHYHTDINIKQIRKIKMTPSYSSTRMSLKIYLNNGEKDIYSVDIKKDKDNEETNYDRKFYLKKLIQKI